MKVFEQHSDQREPELMRLPIMQAQRHSTTTDILNPEKDKKTSVLNNSMRRRLVTPASPSKQIMMAKSEVTSPTRRNMLGICELDAESDTSSTRVVKQKNVQQSPMAGTLILPKTKIKWIDGHSKSISQSKF